MVCMATLYQNSGEHGNSHGHLLLPVVPNHATISPTVFYLCIKSTIDTVPLKNISL